MTVGTPAFETINAATVPALLARRVAASPGAVAFQTELATGQWSPVTWAAFATRVELLRGALHVAGLRPGDRLAIIAPVSLEWELLHHAALSLGAVVAGMDSHDLPERIEGMVELADINAFAVASPKVLALLTPQRWARCRMALQLSQSTDAWPAGALPVLWDELSQLGSASAPSAPGSPNPKDNACIIFTSGTTGKPKGIAYRHEQVCLAISVICEVFPFVGPESRLLCWLPLSNLFQRIVNLAGMKSGAVSYLLGEPRRVMDVVTGVSPDVFVGVPRFYEKLYDGMRARVGLLPRWQQQMVEWAWETGRRSSSFRQQRQPMPIGLSLRWAFADQVVLRRVRTVMGSRLKCMVTGSAPTPAWLLEEFYAVGWVLLEAYGLSESIVPVAMNRIDDFQFGTVGRPFACHEVTISEDGIVCVKGPGVCADHLGAKESKDVLTNRVLDTGDIGFLLPNGHLLLTGRADDVFKTSTGRRVAPSGIEARLRQSAGVEDALIFGAGRKGIIAICTFQHYPNGMDQRRRAALEVALLDRLNELSPADRPQGVLLLERPFSVAAGELTPSLKLRRQEIEQRFEPKLKELTAEIWKHGPQTSRVLLKWLRD